jgi:hypothetical protein
VLAEGVVAKLTMVSLVWAMERIGQGDPQFGVLVGVYRHGGVGRRENLEMRAKTDT